MPPSPREPTSVIDADNVQFRQAVVQQFNELFGDASNVAVGTPVAQVIQPGDVELVNIDISASPNTDLHA